MNKREISELMARRLDIKKFESYQFIDFMIQVMVEQLERGRKVLISNFGTFKIIQRENKRVINPNTQNPMIIPSKKIVKFIPSKNLKQSIAEK